MLNPIGKFSLVTAALMIALPGCPAIYTCGLAVRVRSVTGTIANAETMQPLSDVVILMSSVTDGVVKGSGSSATRASQPPRPEDGAFVMGLATKARDNCFGLFPVPAPEFPVADELRVKVILDTCEQELTIAINDDTSVQITEGGRVIELQLLDTIFVPPCPPPANSAVGPNE